MGLALLHFDLCYKDHILGSNCQRKILRAYVFQLLGDLVLRSKFPMPPLLHTSVSEQVLASLKQDPDSVAVIDGVSGQATTRAQLAEQIQRAAGWMKQNINTGNLINVAI